jgi:SAM-dependent methyltransferase
MQITIKKLLSLLRRRLRSSSSHCAGEQGSRSVFASVYEQGLWGKKRGAKFYSGPGSHDVQLSVPYIGAVRDFLAAFAQRPSVVDLGCGDFNIGHQLRDLCGLYIACDVVPELIEHNKTVYGEQDVSFQIIDIAGDTLPVADVAFVRQVLQHMSNDQILQLVPKLSHFRHVIVTEHLPAQQNFVANLDHPKGPGIRLNVDSGVVLTAFPFDLKPKSERILCSVHGYGGVIRTTVYEMH